MVVLYVVRFQATLAQSLPKVVGVCTLVLLSLLFEHHLTFVLNPVYVGALAIMAIAVWQITGDGEALAYEGWALVALYVILATVTFYE